MHKKYLLRYRVFCFRHFSNMFQATYETEFQYMRFLSVVTNIVKWHGFPPLGTGSDWAVALVTHDLEDLTFYYLTEYKHNLNFDKMITNKESDGIAR